MVLIVFREIWNGPNAVNRWRDGNPCLVKCDIYEMHVKSSWILQARELPIMTNGYEITQRS